VDSFTETSSQSWFSRILESIKGIVVGLGMTVLAFPLLFWNEGRAVQTAQSLEEGAGSVVSVSADRVDAGNEGRLVHLSGQSAASAPVRDAMFGVEEEKALKLVRRVEMYQWDEEKKSETKSKLGGGTETVTTYDYRKVWSDDLKDSSSFRKPDGHQNPSSMPVESTTVVAEKVTVGAYTLSEAQVAQLDRQEKLRMDQAAADAVEGELAGKLRAHEGMLYIAADPASPAVGDARISWSVVRPGPVSLVARQVQGTFEPYRAKAGDDILLVKEGTFSADAMFQAAQEANTVLTWVLRGVFFFVMFLGIFLLFRPFAVFADVIPLMGTLLGAGIGIFAFALAAAMSVATIAVAWVFYRPLLGISLLLLAAAALGGLVFLGLRKKQQRAAATPVAA
jgi:hypothetical protein